MESTPVAVVVPAWNEEATIATVVRRCLPHGTVVVVVDDHSSDRTAERAREAGAVVVSHAENRGYDGALESGCVKVRELAIPWIVTLDADDSHDPDAIPRLGDALWAGAHVVVGRRTFRERSAERLFGLWTGWRWGVTDPLSGMKAYRTELLERFGRFDRYGSVGTDLLLRAAVAGLPIAEIPVPYRKRDGVPRFGSLWRANLRILRALRLGIVHSRREANA